MSRRTFALVLLCACQAATAGPQTTSTLEEVVVLGVKQRLEQAGTLSDAIMKTEVIGATTIEKKNAVNLSEAIDNSPGVRVSNECSMCGVKRIMLNGLKGEQTTILVDGLPVHAMISGYYAVDAIPTTGVERIEVARGAGASLTAPEAIGGTINIITLEPTENGAELDMSIGENGRKKFGILGMGVSPEGATRATLIGQFDARDQVDEDGNKVNESPLQENRSLIARISQDIGLKDNLVFRYGNTSSTVFGGPMLGETFADGKASSIGTVLSSFDNVAAEGYELFEDGDVRKDYIGKAWETTEWIQTDRDEVSLSWLHELTQSWNMTLAGSYANHEQDSFYEGFDYTAEDRMVYLDARFNGTIGAAHLLTVGADARSEKMRSDSREGTSNPNYISDAFDYDVRALYIQDSWRATDALEVVMVLRFDHVVADFVDPAKPGVEIDERILSPRLDLRYLHNDQWTSRLSAGRGYRAPLSFFETDHGILDSELGFAIDVDKLERSTSATYSLNFTGERLTSTVSLAGTEVANLAALSHTPEGVPLLTQLDEKASVATADIALGYEIVNDLTLNFTAEYYHYDEQFKSSYAIAPIEQRLTLGVDWDVAGWDLYANAVWIGPRDLSDYGYDGYNIANAAGVVESTRKTTDAPSYWTMDFRVSKEINETFTVYVGAQNLFNYRQVVDEDTPLFFNAAASYDVAYIYGPLRGREAYAGISARF